MRRQAAVITLLALLWTVVASPGQVSAADPCTEAGVISALTTPGFHTFSCAGPTTVTLGSTTTVGIVTTTLDGGGLLTISGGHARRLIFVGVAGHLTLQNLGVRDGHST